MLYYFSMNERILSRRERLSDEPLLSRRVRLSEDSAKGLVFIEDMDIERSFFVASTLGADFVRTLLDDSAITFQMIDSGVNASSTYPTSVVFDVDGVLRTEGRQTHKLRESIFEKLNERGIPYGIWTRNGRSEYGESISATHRALQTPGKAYLPSFGINFDNWPFRLRNQIGFWELPDEFKQIGKDLNQYIQWCTWRGEYDYKDVFLECKSPRLLAHLESLAQYSDRLSQGILIDDKPAAVVGALLFGHSLIHVESPDHLPIVEQILGL